MSRPEPNNGNNAADIKKIHDEMLAKFDGHGFLGPCADCGMVPYSSITVTQWIHHHMADEIVRLRKSSGTLGK